MTSAVDTPRRRIPGPNTGPLYASPQPYIADKLNLLTHYAATYGDVCAFRLGFFRICLVNHPDLVQQVLVREHKNVEKSIIIKASRVLLGNGLLTSEGEFHDRQRRLMSPAFHRRRMGHYADAMTRRAAQLRDTWEPGAQVDMALEMNRLTLGIIGETMFGADVAEAAEEVHRCLGDVFAMVGRIVSPLDGLVKSVLPLPSNYRFLRARHRLNQIVYGLIRTRQHAPGADDVLSMLLSARDTEGDGTGMTLRQIRDEVLILFLAGHETTANALTWTWYLLSQHPEVAAKLHAEVDRLGGRTPGLEDLAALPYTRQVVEESIRMFPPVYVIDRLLTTDLNIGGYHVPKGVTVFVSPWLLHHDARFFPDPLRFDPERWTPEAKAARPKFCYFPFGAGPRICIGEHFAWTEATLLLATIAQRWNPQLAPGHRVEPEPVIVVRPKGGMPMQLVAR